jgi:hypothetical protein
MMGRLASRVSPGARTERATRSLVPGATVRWGVLLLAASTAVGIPTAAGCSTACTFDDPDVAGRDRNPDGIPYPTDRLGTRPRQGTTPGDHFPNLTFQGYPDSNRAAGLQTISLADYYDPQASRHRVLHVMAAAMWCPHCQNETDRMAELAPTLRTEGAEFVQVVINGPSSGTAADLCDVDSWMEEHATNFTVVFDARAKRLGAVADVSAVPWNALIDTRTMEVLDVSVGAPADFAAYVRAALDVVGPAPG